MRPTDDSGAQTESASEALLAALGLELWGEATKYIHASFDPTSVAGSPIIRLIRAQHAESAERFQLPEPILGCRGRVSVLVVGINPGYNPLEEIPRFGWSADDYIAFYRHRYVESHRDSRGRPVSILSDGRDQVVKHYAVVERMLRGALGPQPIGRGAAYADAVPWKAKETPLLVPDICALARTRIERVVSTLDPTMIITLGAKTAQILSLYHATLQPAVMETRLGIWVGPVLTVLHPNARFTGVGNQGRYVAAVQACIREAMSASPRERTTGA